MLRKSEFCMRRAVMVSLFCNVILVIIKIVALILVNSLAIAMDLGISFVGLSISIILYYSIKMSNRPADLIHNYGYGKVEHVCEILEGVVLIGIAFAMSSVAVIQMFHPKQVALPQVGFISSVINAVLNFGGAYYIFIMAKKSHSPAIRAEAIHYRLEGFISAAIATSFIISIYLQSQGYRQLSLYMDPVTAIVVSLILIFPSFKLAKDSFFKLLDASVGEDSQMEILKQLTKHAEWYCEFRDLKSRTSGRSKFIEFKLIEPEDKSFRKSHEVASMLEREIKSSIPHCEVLIKVEPCKKDCDYAKSGLECPYL